VAVWFFFVGFFGYAVVSVAAGSQGEGCCGCKDEGGGGCSWASGEGGDGCGEIGRGCGEGGDR